ncbi:MAG: dUTP diphosphatase [Ethanoligenens sp.]|uniref:dUTP diphosphatase n=1 Tax=Ethanoligenens sp. TaxID=2099655 RepID=UPI0039E8841E
MFKVTLKVKTVPHDGVEIQKPHRATNGAAGFDLFAALRGPVKIAPHGLVSIPTGIAIQLPDDGYAAFIYARSGLAVRHGIALSNGVGVIDSDYTGELIVGLCNLSDRAYVIMPGERIAQLVISPVCVPELVEVKELEQTARAGGGFGSTGRY